MHSIVWVLVSSLLLTVCLSVDPTNYEYFTSGGIKSGLKADSDIFTLNDKQITLFSGSLHYFRLPQEYWKDRLTKFRAGGLNAVETYVSWNLHEETPGNFDFETGFLNLRNFIKAAKEADLFVVFRIGPFICAEWEFGGFPAWLLRDPQMRLRSNYKPYLKAVERYFNKVLPIINDLQFTKGGPIIALQFENEFGGIHNDNDREYFQFMKDLIEKSGFKELLINCDPGDNAARAVKTILPGVLQTDNMNSNSVATLNTLRKAQPNKPLFVTEFWPGRFDYWGDKEHHKMSIDYFEKEVSDILFVANSSINFYMFFGGTNFGFTNGDNVTTSYDYNCPLSESGNYTDKYWKAKELFEKLTKQRGLPKTRTPEPPKIEGAAHYGFVKMNDFLSFEDLLSQIKPIQSNQPKYMEFLDIGPNYGQNFGFILYRTSTQKFKHLKINGIYMLGNSNLVTLSNLQIGGVSDRGIILIDDREISPVVYNKDYQINTSDSQFGPKSQHKLDILVENTGRSNVGPTMNSARKGLNGDVFVDNTKINKYDIFPLEFKQKFVESLKHLKGRALTKVNSPSLFRAELHISGKPMDTFLRLDNWKKGNVFVNGFNIGRYFDIGPQKTLYVPAPLLKTGSNDIFVFELHSNLISSDKIEFVDKPDLGK